MLKKVLAGRRISVALQMTQAVSRDVIVGAMAAMSVLFALIVTLAISSHRVLG
jgi:hypothetical protein